MTKDEADQFNDLLNSQQIRTAREQNLIGQVHSLVASLLAPKQSRGGSKPKAATKETASESDDA